MTGTIHLAANNGDVGGGEVMLLHTATALSELGWRVHVLGPAGDDGVLARAAAAGHDVTELGSGRVSYMVALGRWRLSHRRAPLWCHGLVPSLATTGPGPRIVHLHQVPTARRRAVVEVARRGADVVLAPSRAAAAGIPGARVLPNWTADLPLAAPGERLDGTDRGPIRVGYLGRLTTAKGVAVLARAVEGLPTASSRPLRLVLAGEERFASADDAAEIEDALLPISGRTDRIGWVDPAEFFASVDLAVFPSVAPESFGLVVAEAMAAGVPFVVSDAGALPEVAGPDHPWVARHGDVGSLRASIERALDDLTAHGHVRRAGDRRRWEEEFSPAAGRHRVAELMADLRTVSRGDRR